MTSITQYKELTEGRGRGEIEGLRRVKYVCTERKPTMRDAHTA